MLTACAPDDKLTVPPAMLEADAHAEVRAIVNEGFTQLMEWLEVRLQQQEDNLRSLVTAQELRTSQGGAKMEPQVSSQEEALQQCPPTFEANREQRQPAMAPVKSQARMSEVPTRTASSDPEQIWVSSLVGIFDQLDLMGTGSIDILDLEDAFRATGFSEVQALHLFHSMDKSGNGTIDRLEWLNVVSLSARGSDDEMRLLQDFLSRLVDLQRSKAFDFQAGRAKHFRMIIRHDSICRVMWDVVVVMLLLYVALSVPVSIGFGSNQIMDHIDLGIDIFFCFDVALNFRTSYLDRDDTVVLDWKKIGSRYLKSWFFIDFFSSVPFEYLTAGVVPDLTPARFLKTGKIVKVLKLLRITRIKSLLKGNSETFEKLKTRLTSRQCTRVLRMLRLLVIAFLFAHWLTCFSSAVDSTAFDEYFAGLGQVPTVSQRYLAGMYWAMTTISTVGYGDITPVSDSERAFYMIAMVVGGALYGFIVGNVTSIVTDMDVQTYQFHEHMEVIQSWLDRHSHMPLLLRRRLRKHFKIMYYAKSVIEDHAVIDQLSGELRGDAAYYIIDEHVRHHPMVMDLSNRALAELVYVMKETRAKAHEFIVHIDDPGLGMYFLVEGLARYDRGWRWQLSGTKAATSKFQHITIGESFGEEIIFGLAETYAYTVITIVDCKFKWIDESDFRSHFENLPHLHAQMYAAIVNPRISSDADTAGSNANAAKEVTI